MSNDGGAHWSRQRIAANIAQPPFAGAWEFVAIDADHWRYVDTTSIASTDDAGKTWSVQPNRIPFGAPVAAKAAVSFLTPNTAFAVQCDSTNCVAVVTTNNGMTWTRVPS